MPCESLGSLKHSPQCGPIQVDCELRVWVTQVVFTLLVAEVFFFKYIYMK